MIVLIGYRGTGKTTVARLLAARLGWTWADLDDAIEQRAGKSIAAVFAEEGEPAFRDFEQRELARLVTREQLVLATGGGVVVRPENRELLQGVSQRGGRVVWLRASPETIHERMSRDGTTAARRPNLTAAGGLNEIIQVLRQRMPWYAQCADATLDTEDKTPEQAVDALCQLPTLQPLSSSTARGGQK
jgi:shikimate kinase